MRSKLRVRSLLRTLAAGVLAALLLSGCNPVRQDRTITFSKNGDAVGFQHDADGVYVAGKDGGPPIKVFQPGPNDTAVSTPLWNPKDNRLIFTTAKGKEHTNVRVSFLFAGDNAAGALYNQQPVTYTCWLRPEPTDAANPEPVALFEATCDHIGYVAANFAVRWKPSGDRILYIKETSNGRHGLFEYALGPKTSRQVFPHAAKSLIFDWTPDGTHLVCVLANSDQEDSSGIWIGEPGADDWWHVPGSRHLAAAPLNSPLERLKATRPAWTKDGARFAFITSLPKKDPQEPEHHVLRVGTLAERQTHLIASGTEPLHDLHWTPDGKRLGLVRGDPGSLHFVDGEDKLSPPMNRRPVRHFIGWSADGKRLAYTTPDPLPYATDKYWAFLMLPDPLARDAVQLAAGAGDPGDMDDLDREVFSGMRVTFPSWSPKEDKLSLWFTFSPPYRSWGSYLFGLGLRPGDPAAVFDVKSGEIGWMAVNGYEKAQIGHFHSMKREYAAALARYQEAERELPPPARPTLEEFARNLQSPRDITLFEYHCLKKLGRNEQADAKLDVFRRTFLPDLAAETRIRIADWLGERGEIWLALVREFYAAEVFLSVNAAADAPPYFESALKSAKTDGERLSTSLALGQVFLIDKKFAEYADLTTDTILPLLVKMTNPQPSKGKDEGILGRPNEELVTLSLLGLAPLESPEFLRGLPADRVTAWLDRWTMLHELAKTEATQFELDLMLYAGHDRLGRERERAAVWDRIGKSPLRDGRLPKGDYADPAADLRRAFAKMLAPSDWPSQ